MRFLSNLIASIVGTLVAFGIVFLFLFLMFAAILATGDQTPRLRAGTVLVIPFSGAIPEVAADDPFVQAFSGRPRFDLLELVSSLENAADDDRVAAVWMQMENVQASWGTLYEVRSALEAFRASGKPIYASSNDFMMNEAAYYLASVADSVFAAPGAMFEYNGFFIASTFFKRMLDNLEIEPEIVRAGEFKAAAEPFTREDLSPENEEQLAAILTTQNDVFMEAVSRSRGIPVEELDRMTQESAILTTEGAYEAGLLDRLMYADEVRDLLKDRLGVDRDGRLRTVELRQYARVPGESSLRRTGRGEVAVVYASGTIISGRSDQSPIGQGEVVGSRTFGAAMREARENDRVEAVVVRIDSPGGSASASEVMWREIELTAREKPVVVSMGSLAASGGYWLATGGDAIVASPLTITGSIGVFSMLFDASGFFEEKIGVTFDVIRTSPYADIFSGVRPLSPPERELLQRWTDETYRLFLKRVADNRNMEITRVDEVAQGRVWSGRDALENGLVDQLGTLRTAVDLAAERAGLEPGEFSIRLLPRPVTFLERLSQNISAEVRHVASFLLMSREERQLRDRLIPLSTLLRDMNAVQARMPFDLEIR